MKNCLLIFFVIFGWNLFALDWNTAVTISAVDVDRPSVGVDGQGDGIATWGPVTGIALLVAYYTKSTNSWAAPITVDTGTISRCYIAVNSTGDAVVVYNKHDGSNNRLAAAVYTKSTNSWSLSGYLSAAGQNISIGTWAGIVGIDASGNAVATWARSNGSNTIVQAAVYTRSTNSWSSPTNLSASGQNANTSYVAVNLSGDALASWQRSDGSRVIIQAASYTASTDSWSSVEDLSATGQNASEARVGIDDNGDGIVIWSRFTGVGFNEAIQSSYYTRSSDSWSSASNVSATDQASFFPSIAVNGDGNAIAVWFNDTNGGIESSLYTKSSNSWSSVLAVVNSGGGSQEVAIDGNGNGIAVFKTLANTIQSSAFTQTTTSWSSATTISTTVGITPFIAMNSLGDAIATWEQSEGGIFSGPAQAATTSFVNAPASASGRQLVNKFVSLKEHFNRISWALSDSLGVASYNIYRDGVLIASVSSTTYSYDDHNRTPGVSYTYGISAVTTSGGESSQTTVVVSG